MKKKQSIIQSIPYKGKAENYDNAGKQPVNWMPKAAQINRAARIIFKIVEKDFNKLSRQSRLDNDKSVEIEPTYPFLMDVFIFLAALAIENLLKGILMISKPGLISGGKLTGNLITSHKLSDLSIGSEIEFTEEENELLHAGTEAIESWGRYPIPKNVRKLKSSRTIKLVIGEIYNKLYDKLVYELKERDDSKRHGAL